jgi:ubiquinone/menaquinone biosynthesis C-methylase UbiE
MDTIPGFSKRLNFQLMFAEGDVVNIGCGEDPCGFGERAMHVDMDVWNHKRFTQADAHHLPFKDDEFDTAVLGDILEHSPDPAQMLREAGRVAKKVVATIYEEWRLPQEGLNLGIKTAEMYDKGLEKEGFKNLWDYFQSLPSHRGRVISVCPDDELSHHPHIYQFTQAGLEKIIEESGLKISIFTKFQEGEHEGRPTYNWLLVAHK